LSEALSERDPGAPLNPTKLPEPNGNFQWSVVADFSVSDAILADPGLKPIFEQALRQGCGLVAQKN
jgi:hypothetical protein